MVEKLVIHQQLHRKRVTLHVSVVVSRYGHATVCIGAIDFVSAVEMEEVRESHLRGCCCDDDINTVPCDLFE